MNRAELRHLDEVLTIAIAGPIVTALFLYLL